MSFWDNLPKPLSVLAPMEDVTDTVFRQIIADCGRPDVFITEFTSTDGLFSAGRDGVIRRLKYIESEKPLVAQIWGNNPENYFKAGELLNEMGFDGIDINMGCPVRKVVGRGECSGLIDNPNLARELILACKEGAGDLPVSVKTRLGNKKDVGDVWAATLLELDIAALTMHGRLAKDMSKYPADWDKIARVVEIRDDMKKDTLIIGNGDVERTEEIKEKSKKYNVDGVMIGRGVFKDPFVFNPNRTLADLNIEERLELLLKHTRLFVETWGENRNFPIMKKFFKIYVSGFNGAAEYRALLMSCKNLEEVEKTVGTFDF